MDFNIITGLPSWYILICIFSGILASMILYFRERKSELPVWLKRLLGVNRFVIVTLVAFLLLSPLLKMISRHSEKPIIVVAHDNSMSLVMGSDSSYYRAEYLEQLNEVLEELSNDYELRLFTFGEEITALEALKYDTLTFNEKLTDMASVFEMMDVRFANRNTGALVIAGDGIFNKGINPRYHYTTLTSPVYTIALGDTSLRRDAYLKRVLYNRIAFQGNDFPVEFILNANKLDGATISVNLSEGGKSIISQQVPVTGNNFSKTIRININAGSPGIHHYVLRISSNSGEVSLDNNRYDLFIDVLQSKQKVLILAQAPHPDISALKEAISSNINYEVDDRMLTEMSGPLQEYSLVILHQLPAATAESNRLISQLNRAGVPILYIVGPQTNVSAFNAQGTSLYMTPYNQSGMNEAVPFYNNAFSAFKLSDGLKDLIPFMPPLHTLFAQYEVRNAGGILFYQKIGSVEGTDPLWILDKGQNVKNAIVCGTGLWRWRMKTWQETGDHVLFNELINKTIQFLAVKEDKRRFRVNAPENIPENRPVEIKAELYNESYEAVNETDVNLEIRDEQDNVYEFIMNKTEDIYTLNAGNFPVGTYSYLATTRLGDKVFTDDGGFTVSPVVAEQVSLRAAHGLLEILARENDGSMLSKDNMSELPGIIRDRGDVKPVIHSDKKFIEFIDIWWVLVIILALLGTEWFLRKWSGSY